MPFCVGYEMKMLCCDLRAALIIGIIKVHICIEREIIASLMFMCVAHVKKVSFGIYKTDR